jgi:cysteinyl-tRNA synthetase
MAATAPHGRPLRLRLFDTLTAAARPFVPRVAGEATVYCCGPTTYDVAHVGHARAALAPDVLVRHLRAEGLRVKYVRNVTDVDDKILKRAQERGEEPLALSARMTRLYQEDMRALGCVDPDVEPKVSEHIPQIVALIERLIARDAAYVVEMPGGTHDVYYAVRAFPSYGKLSKRKIEELQVGARIEASESKRDPLDFALWKGAASGGWGWDSPWGRGRPGWHIECSAMSEEHLGYGFDVHAGGMDLIFPHHENEIAQSEAAHAGEGGRGADAAQASDGDGGFCRTWIHNGFVNVDKEKMAKSLGNFVTIRQVYERNDPEALRWFLLGVHYRGPIGFDTEKLDDGRVVFPGVVEAERRVDYMVATRQRLAELAATAGDAPLPKIVPKEVGAAAEIARRAEGEARAALDDDLDTPRVLAVLGEIAKAANELADVVPRRKKDTALQTTAPTAAAALARALDAIAARIGVLQVDPAEYAARTRVRRLAARGLTEEGVQARIEGRTAARAAKDFARGDAIRDELAALGVEIADGPAGTTWRLAP